MRARLFVITSLAVAAVIGAASAPAAHAVPQGPGNISDKPTATTQPPKGPDKLASKPTTTTIPQGPGDLAPAPKGDPKPDGSDPVAEPSPIPSPSPTTTPSPSPTTLATAIDAAKGDAARVTAAQSQPGFPVLVVVLVAGLVGALVALVGLRFGRNGGDARRG
ncbi:MAG: hypothetical protein QOG90_2468 [Actinomycetota bacterium]|jgi:hypothetical protein